MATVADLQTVLSDINDNVSRVAAKVSDLTAQVDALKAQVASSIQPADLDPVKAQADAIDTAIKAI